jgi:hypothetical protein
VFSGAGGIRTPDLLVEANSVKRFTDEVGLFEEIVLGIGDLVDDQLLETIESFWRRPSGGLPNPCAVLDGPARS